MRNHFEVLNSIIDSTAVIDNDGIIVFTNWAWKDFSVANGGHPDKTDDGTNYLNICTTVEGNEREDAFRALAGISKVIKNESAIFEFEYPCHSPKEERWFIMRCNRLASYENFFLISHINITNRKLSEQHIQAQNKQFKDINARLHKTQLKIVHDKQSPLNALEGLINISRIENSSESIDGYFRLIADKISGLKLFIQDTLKITTESLKIESIDFATLMAEFHNSVSTLFELKNVEFILNIIQPQTFYNYKQEIQTIISNVVSNIMILKKHLHLFLLAYK